MKQKEIKIRNPAAIPAHSRTSAGPMKNKILKRINGKNERYKFLEEVDNEDKDKFDCWD